MRKIQLVSSARKDIATALHYYQQSGIGEERFQELVTIRLEQIASYPMGLIPIKPEITSTPLSIKRSDQDAFPYHIYYTSTEMVLIVLRVFHTRQHPDKAFDFSQF